MESDPDTVLIFFFQDKAVQITDDVSVASAAQTEITCKLFGPTGPTLEMVDENMLSCESGASQSLKIKYSVSMIIESNARLRWALEMREVDGCAAQKFLLSFNTSSITHTEMKVLTTNFVQCAVKECAKTGKAFPLKFSECEMKLQESEFDPQFIINILPKLDWAALKAVAADLGETIPDTRPEVDPESESPETVELLQTLHKFLIEAQIESGAMTCESCGHTYRINNGIANFLLPPHLTNSA